MGKSKIEWTDETWNPVSGCTKVSDGCKHCYAERHWPRLSAPGQPYAGRKFTDVACHPERMTQPLHWKKPRRVFVNSMSDLFHESIPFEFIARAFRIMWETPEHTYQILTKRPERMREYCELQTDQKSWPLPNVWLGVSVENQETANERIPILLKTSAAVRWISAEPLLGPVDVYGGDPDPRLDGAVAGPGVSLEPFWDANGRGPYPGIDWVVVGGESGPRARATNPIWVRSLRDQCTAAGVPFFFKQWGEWAPGDDIEANGIAPIGWYESEPSDGGVPCHTWLTATPIPEDVYRVGKRAAGRLLDGREWSEYPA